MNDFYLPCNDGIYYIMLPHNIAYDAVHNFMYQYAFEIFTLKQGSGLRCSSALPLLLKKAIVALALLSKQATVQHQNLRKLH